MRHVTESIHRKAGKSGLSEGRQFSLTSFREAQRTSCGLSYHQRRDARVDPGIRGLDVRALG